MENYSLQNYGASGQTQENLALLETLFASAPAGMAFLDRELRYVRVNETLARMNGRPVEAHLGRTPTEVLPYFPELDRLMAALRQILITGEPILNFQATAESPATPGVLRYWLGHWYPVRQNDEIIGLGVIIEDITARKRAEMALQESEERYSSLFENNHAALLLIDPQTGDIVDANPAACTFYGYSREELKRKKITEINTLPPEQVAEEMERARSEQRHQFYFQHRLAGGELRHVEVYSGPIKVRGKQLLYSIVHDITERRQAQAAEAQHREALRQSEATMRTLLEFASDGIIISRRGGEMILVNARVEKMFGYSRAELLDRPVEMLLPERYWSSHVAHRADYLRNPQSRLMGHGRLDLAGRRKDGAEFPVEVSLSFVETAEDFLVMSFIRDITERQQTQQVIERNAERIARLYGEAQQEIIARRQVEEQLRLSLQEKEVLLKEIHHRVKNNLQAVSNLIYLQASYSQDQRLRQMFTETQNRIKSIALIHEKLYQTDNFMQIDFVDYIQGLMKHLISSYVIDPDTISVRVASSDVQLDVETAVPLGIIINELVSNSLEHAFPAGAARVNDQINEITIELKRDSDQQFSLVVQDNGIGLPETIDPATSPSLGLQLVKMLTDHMGGSLDLERNGGTTFLIKFSSLPKGSD